VDRGDSGAGWAVAVIVLLAVLLFGIFIWPGIRGIPSGNASTPTPTTPDAIDVNVQLPQGLQGSGDAQRQGTPGADNAAPNPAQ
jgi:hypothetical protein